MKEYLSWLAKNTDSEWWNDSASLADIDEAIDMGACGVTTNPVLICETITNEPEVWKPYLAHIPEGLSKDEKTEAIIKAVTVKITTMFSDIYKKTNGEQGYVCAQVDPRRAGDRAFMLDMARRIASWAPNIAVKLPATSAGMSVLEDCVAEGITITSTVSFTFPQVKAAAESYERGIARAKAAGVRPGRCFAVIMLGRIDGFLQDIAADRRYDIPAADLKLGGLAIIKRAYKYFNEHGFHAVLMPAALRGAFHVDLMAGAGMAISINPKIQVMLPEIKKPFGEHIDEEVDPAVIKRLSVIPEFRMAYEPDGMKPEEFIAFGAVQKTLAQFTENYQNIGKYKILR